MSPAPGVSWLLPTLWPHLPSRQLPSRPLSYIFTHPHPLPTPARLTTPTVRPLYRHRIAGRGHRLMASRHLPGKPNSPARMAADNRIRPLLSARSQILLARMVATPLLPHCCLSRWDRLHQSSRNNRRNGCNPSVTLKKTILIVYPLWRISLPPQLLSARTRRRARLAPNSPDLNALPDRPGDRLPLDAGSTQPTPLLSKNCTERTERKRSIT